MEATFCLMSNPFGRLIPILIDVVLDNVHVSERLIYDVFGDMTPLDLAERIADEYCLSPLAAHRLQRIVTAQAAPDCRPLLVLTDGPPCLVTVPLCIVIDGIGLKDTLCLDVNNKLLDLDAVIDNIIREKALGLTHLSYLKWRKAIMFQVLTEVYKAVECSIKQLDPPQGLMDVVGTCPCLGPAE